jgi:hypothetical protein
MGVPDPLTTITGRPPIESQPNELRHALVQWSAWLLCNPVDRLREVYGAGAILANHFTHDFEAPPDWYVGSLPIAHR